MSWVRNFLLALGFVELTLIVLNVVGVIDYKQCIGAPGECQVILR